MAEPFVDINGMLAAGTIRILDDGPLSCDLTTDPLACAILHAWARQPWQEAHRAALVDHLLETGRSEEEVWWARGVLIPRLGLPLRRRSVRRGLKQWRLELIKQFGDFTNP